MSHQLPVFLNSKCKSPYKAPDSRKATPSSDSTPVKGHSYHHPGYASGKAGLGRRILVRQVLRVRSRGMDSILRADLCLRDPSRPFRWSWTGDDEADRMRSDDQAWSGSEILFGEIGMERESGWSFCGLYVSSEGQVATGWM